MNKKVTAIASIALLSTSLAACNANNGAMDEGNNGNRGNGNAQPIGYYTNENTNRDNEGPVTEFLDGRNNAANQQGNRNAATRGNQGTNGNTNQPTQVNQGNQGRTSDGNQANNQGNNSMRQVNNATNNNGQNNQTAQQGNQNNGANRNNRYTDMNYHGHLNTEGYYGREERELSERVRETVEKMNNVENANVVVTDDNILVAVDTNDNNDKAMKENITKELRNVTSGRNVQVVTDEGTVSRVRNINNNINNGGERGMIDTDINNLMNDLGDAIRRPFTGNR
ncbi:YhcN/YlaJ family sporulation lipoprotein [Metabacillus malikii]|uniref:Spore cortex protein n=1 Tax=Metabacillus malikii TaxID=1504265 RepID=A0ABT9ZHX5_9BACI|nr:YhcN/YlaJ family sporulation lipoprotein [Metabacillus malikii]MDQ0231499.1 spore cortex protein [Metabacillus malikii]